MISNERSAVTTKLLLKGLNKTLDHFGKSKHLIKAIKPFNPSFIHANIYTWQKYKRVPAHYALLIHAITKGQICCWEVAPDMYPPKVFRDVEISLTVKDLIKIYRKT
ncbi:MAG: hypothetical protein KAS32_11440 [Candidatus Peribacteraceae bacterium]|nr:hypothetical protein [Candidatus Peribacteraceae bacterium]